ncbi:hypothetical protein SLA2020_292910 [Shorea laevis]
MAKGTVAPTKKKTKAAADTTDSPSVLHPPYFEMISEAISTLKERSGSSQQAMAKFISDKYGDALPPNFKKMLSVQLKKFVKSERLVKIKNSYKISSTEKLKLEIKEARERKNVAADNSAVPKEKAANKNSEKSVKTKRLSQVRTPEALKKVRKDDKKQDSGKKVKRLSLVKTPEGWRRKNLQSGRRKEAKKKAEN